MMRLSEAIRVGAAKRPRQAFHRLYDDIVKPGRLIMAKPTKAPAVMCAWQRNPAMRWYQSHCCGARVTFEAKCALETVMKWTYCPFCGGRIKVQE